LSYKVTLATEQYGLQFKSSGILSPEKFVEWVHEIEKEDAKLLKEFLDFGKVTEASDGVGILENLLANGYEKGRGDSILVSETRR